MKGTVLLVDDSAVMRKLVLRTLKTAEMDFEQVLEASDGPGALSCLRTHTVEFILCDINMPGMSGVELVQQIQAQHLALGVPIVMVTSDGGEEQVRQAIVAGARGYIRKPFTVEQLQKYVRPMIAA